MKLSLVLITIIVFSCSTPHSRNPSSMTNEIIINANYSGYPIILSEHEDLSQNEEELLVEQATKFCQKIGAQSGIFTGIHTLDFGHRGPNRASRYDDAKDSFELLSAFTFWQQASLRIWAIVFWETLD